MTILFYDPTGQDGTPEELLTSSYPSLSIRPARTEAEFLRALDRLAPDLVVAGAGLNGTDLQAALSATRESARYIPFLILSSRESEDEALALTDAGADDYILTDNLKRLPLSVRNAMSRAPLSEAPAGAVDGESGMLQRLREERLQHNEMRLNQAQAIAHFGSWELDLSTGIASWSEEALRIFGLPADHRDLSYELWQSFIHPEDRDHVLRISEESRQSHCKTSVFHRIVRRDGTIRHIHSISSFEFDAAGRPVCLYGVTHDLSDIRELQLALKESESRYRDLFQLSPQPMWIYDPESFRFISVNDAAVRHYGYSREEFLDMTIMDIRSTPEQLRLKHLFGEQSGSDNASRSGQYRHRTKSGEQLDVEVYGCAFVSGNRNLRSVIVIDITEKQRHEDNITRAIIQAQEEERYAIGVEMHDNVCQILATSLLSLAMLKPGLSPALLQTYHDCRGKIRLSLTEIRNLSHRLAPAIFEDESFESAIEKLAHSFNVTGAYDIRLSFDSAVNSRDLNLDLKLCLYRIVQEQLGNIVKHAMASAISIGFIVRDSTLLLDVSDNGQGGDITGNGHGIGFRNIMRRVELYDGTVGIELPQGRGCTISVAIPVPQPHPAETGKSSLLGLRYAVKPWPGQPSA